MKYHNGISYAALYLRQGQLKKFKKLIENEPLTSVVPVSKRAFTWRFSATASRAKRSYTFVPRTSIFDIVYVCAENISSKNERIKFLKQTMTCLFAAYQKSTEVSILDEFSASNIYKFITTEKTTAMALSKLADSEFLEASEKQIFRSNLAQAFCQCFEASPSSLMSQIPVLLPATQEELSEFLDDNPEIRKYLSATLGSTSKPLFYTLFYTLATAVTSSRYLQERLPQFFLLRSAFSTEYHATAKDLDYTLVCKLSALKTSSQKRISENVAANIDAAFNTLLPELTASDLLADDTAGMQLRQALATIFATSRTPPFSEEVITEILETSTLPFHDPFQRLVSRFREYQAESCLEFSPEERVSFAIQQILDGNYEQLDEIFESTSFSTQVPKETVQNLKLTSSRVSLLQLFSSTECPTEVYRHVDPKKLATSLTHFSQVVELIQTLVTQLNQVHAITLDATQSAAEQYKNFLVQHAQEETSMLLYTFLHDFLQELSVTTILYAEPYTQASQRNMSLYSVLSALTTVFLPTEHRSQLLDTFLQTLPEVFTSNVLLVDEVNYSDAMLPTNDFNLYRLISADEVDMLQLYHQLSTLELLQSCFDDGNVFVFPLQLHLITDSLSHSSARRPSDTSQTATDESAALLANTCSRRCFSAFLENADMPNVILCTKAQSQLLQVLHQETDLNFLDQILSTSDQSHLAAAEQPTPLLLSILDVYSTKLPQLQEVLQLIDNKTEFLRPSTSVSQSIYAHLISYNAPTILQFCEAQFNLTPDVTGLISAKVGIGNTMLTAATSCDAYKVVSYLLHHEALELTHTDHLTLLTTISSKLHSSLELTQNTAFTQVFSAVLETLNNSSNSDSLTKILLTEFFNPDSDFLPTISRYTSRSEKIEQVVSRLQLFRPLQLQLLPFLKFEQLTDENLTTSAKQELSTLASTSYLHVLFPESFRSSFLTASLNTDDYLSSFGFSDTLEQSLDRFLEMITSANTHSRNRISDALLDSCQATASRISVLLRYLHSSIQYFETASSNALQAIPVDTASKLQKHSESYSTRLQELITAISSSTGTLQREVFKNLQLTSSDTLPEMANELSLLSQSLQLKVPLSATKQVLEKQLSTSSATKFKF